jgi:hypothetical protein
MPVGMLVTGVVLALLTVYQNPDTHYDPQLNSRRIRLNFTRTRSVADSVVFVDIIYTWPIWVPVGIIFFLMFAANELAYRVARSRRGEEPERSHNTSIAQKGSILGLVALLLGFSFSITSSRYDARQRLVLDEANSIGTCFLRAGLVPEPHRGRLRVALREYTDRRIALCEHLIETDEYRKTACELDKQLVELWAALETAMKANHELTFQSHLIPAANQVIDLCSARAWSDRYHMPPAVLLVLGISAVTCSGLMGHSSGQVGRRHLNLWISLNVLLVLVLYVVLDFDRPRLGMIRVDTGPLVDLRNSMVSSPP